MTASNATPDATPNSGSNVIRRIEWATLEGQRPRSAGCNARLGEHGLTVRVPVARITLNDGSSGWGRCRATRQEAQSLIGQPLAALFDSVQGTLPAGMPFDLPLWDLIARCLGQPVYKLAAALRGKSLAGQLRVPCYDTSLYIDDLHLADDDSAAALIADEARQGLARGHRAFKIKVGRGARHLPLAAGTQRDIAVIRAVRAAVGTDATIMIDANNGYNLNLAKQVLQETAACNLFWLEEAFHEDRVLYGDLREWMKAQGLAVLIADGEGEASPSLLNWAKDGVLDLVQYDIFSYGFTNWLHLSKQLDAWGVRTAPHHYGAHVGNFITCHLAPAVDHFAFVEWDEATTPGIDSSHYRIEAGHVLVPELPGFGLALDKEIFANALTKDGYRVGA